MMTAKALNLIPSGIEPIDKLSGGLEKGHLYLAHGEAAGKSLFGIKFLIEGLKRGENGALAIRYSAEDAVRRFARLGYDCLTDVQQGRLVILEYSEDIINQIQKLSELSPVLRELEWLLKDAHPQRIIFDPVTQLIIGENGELRPRVFEFTNWASSFGATVLLIANGNGNELIQEVQPFVKESFKFDFKEIDGRATRFFTFEKSPTIAEQAVEVDPSRGVFLIEKPPLLPKVVAGEKPAAILTSPYEQTISLPEADAGVDNLEESTDAANRVIEPLIIESPPLAEEGLRARKQSRIAEPAGGTWDEALNQPAENCQSGAENQTVTASHTTEFGRTSEEKAADFFDFLEELDSAIAAIDVNFVEAGAEVRKGANEAGGSRHNAKPIPATVEPGDLAAHALIADRENLVGYSKRAADALYPDDKATHWAMVNTLTFERQEPAQVKAKDCHIVVIDEDDLSCKRISKALEEYTLLSVQDVVSGIANIMATNADLIILDMDMSIVDGFKVLTHIRASTSAPIIVLSKTHIRSADRIFSSELGADYYLTKPFSAKELRQKAKQLIARYKGIDSWIMAPQASQLPAVNPATATPASADSPAELKPAVERRANFLSDGVEQKTERIAAYAQFIDQVEANVKRSMERHTAFSIVGYKLENPQSDAVEKRRELANLLAPFVRNADIVSINDQQELVILLHDTNSIGARAFISRARRRLPENLNQQLSIWMRSFPNLEEAFESAYAS
jgi:DNA-binding response OmpR family regulator/KaiC/GvpD/RAD55 family RecA-like ATPase